MLNRIKKWLQCPNCGSDDVEFRNGYRSNRARCMDCGLKEGDMNPPEDWDNRADEKKRKWRGE